MNRFRVWHLPGLSWRKILLLAGLLGLLSAATAASSQPANGLDVRWLAVDQDETPQVDDADFPRLHAAVTPFGPSGAPLVGLSAANFQLRLAGEPVTAFALEPYAAADQPISVLLLLDTGAAMAPYLDQVKTAVPALYDLLEQSDESALLPFAGPVNPALDPARELGFTNDEGALINLLNAQNAAAAPGDWPAALAKGLRLTAEQAAHERRAVVVLSAGGEDSGVETAVSDALRLGVPVFAMSLGPANAALEAVAAQTGGAYTAVDSAAALAAAFREITLQLRQVYGLRFSADLPADGGRHLLELTVQTPQGTAVAAAEFVARYPLIPAVRGVTAFVPEPVALESLDWVRGRVTLEPDIMARGTVAAVNYYVDGAQTAVFAANAAPWTFRWDTADLPPNQSHTLLIEIIDDANPPHVGVFETAVFVQPCPLACRIAQNSLLAGLLAVLLVAVAGTVIGLALRGRSRAPQKPPPGPARPVARPTNRLRAQDAVLYNQPRPQELAARPTIVDDPRTPAALDAAAVQDWPTDLSTAPTRSGGSDVLPVASSAADLAHTEVLSPDEADVGLAFLIDLTAGQQHRLKARTVIGSATDCGIVVADENVAAHHARIVWEAERFVLYAMTYQHSLQVNGQEVIHALLQDGDRLLIGRLPFVLKWVQ